MSESFLVPEYLVCFGIKMTWCQGNIHLHFCVSDVFFFLPQSKGPGLDPPLYTRKERSFRKCNPDPTCHWEGLKNYFVPSVSKTQADNLILNCNSLSNYVSVSSDADASVIFSFSVPFSLSLYRPDTTVRNQFKFTYEFLQTKTC